MSGRRSIRSRALAHSGALCEASAVNWRRRVATLLRDLPPGVHEVAPAELRELLRHWLGRYYAWEYGFDWSAPPLQPGEVVGPPAFVGIGVQKAGTSWWYRLIMAHPDMSDRADIHKERHYFARFAADHFGVEEAEQYARWFPHRAGTKTGEWTPDYFYYPWVPALLRQAAPEARLLLLLRDPVERFRSGLAQQVRNGEDHVGTAQAEAVGRSLYAASLHRWLECFGRDRLLVLQYEACVADPGRQLALTYEFLELDPSFRPDVLTRAVNRTVEPKTTLPDDALSRLRQLFVPDVEELATLMPDLDVALWPSTTSSTRP